MKQTPHAPLIAPSILSADFARIADEVRRIEDAGADLIHLDVMDGVFVPNISFGPKFVADMRKITKLPFDVHLMITSPERYVPQFIDAGADFLTLHYEAVVCENRRGGHSLPPERSDEAISQGFGRQNAAPTSPESRASNPEIKILPGNRKITNGDGGDLLFSIAEIFSTVKKAGVKCGIVISPDTPVSVLKGILKDCDMVLLMSVYPGFGGQSFIDKSLDRLRELTALAKFENPDILIEIDGGVTVENAPAILAAGAEILVAGNTVFSAKDARKTIRALRSERI